MRRHWRSSFLVILTAITFSVLEGMPVSPAHATGILFVSPSSLPTAATGTNVTVQVKVANVDPFTGWDVEVRTEQRVLNPRTVSVEGNLLAANFSATMLVSAECVNSQGIGCGAEDGFGIVHSAAVSLGSRSLPQGPTSGLLFTITYTILNGGSGVSQIEIVRQIIANGVTNTLVDVSVANGVYGSSQDFGVFLNPLFGSVSQGGEMKLSAVVSSFNGFTGQVNLTATSLLSAYVSPASVFLTPGGSVTAQLFASTTLCDPPSSYSLGLVASSGNVSHTILASPIVLPNTSNPPDFCLIQIERSAVVNAGSTRTLLFELFSVGFNGSVSLSVGVVPSLANGPAVRLLRTAISLFPGGRGLGQIQVSPSFQTSTGQYTIVVNGTGGGFSHFLTMALSIIPPGPAFTISTSLAVLMVARSSNTTDMITLKSLFGFNAPVALGTAIQPFLPTGPKVSLSLYTFQLSSATNSTLTVSAPRGTTLGSYNLTVFANGGGESASVTLRIDVVPLDPLFLTQFQWGHRVSIHHDNGIEIFLVGLRNPNKGTPVFLEVQVDGSDASGLESFHITTGVIELGPLQTLPISLTKMFAPSSVGTTFHFSAVILWGTSPGALSMTSAFRPGTPTSGNFTIVA